MQTYSVLFLLFVFTGLIFLFMTDKVQAHLSINAQHSVFQDSVFPWVTYLGDGRFVGVIALFASLPFLKNKKFLSAVVFGAITLFLVAVIIAVAKQLIFPDAFRPWKYLTEVAHVEFYRIPGVEMHTNQSFPSGHTAAAFGLFGYVAFMYAKNRIVQVACAVAAILVGYSRIYLNQHFLEDVVAGAIVGTACMVIAYFITRAIKFKNNVARID